VVEGAFPRLGDGLPAAADGVLGDPVPPLGPIPPPLPRLPWLWLYPPLADPDPISWVMRFIRPSTRSAGVGEGWLASLLEVAVGLYWLRLELAVELHWLRLELAAVLHWLRSILEFFSFFLSFLVLTGVCFCPPPLGRPGPRPPVFLVPGFSAVFLVAVSGFSAGFLVAVLRSSTGTS